MSSNDAQIQATLEKSPRRRGASDGRIVVNCGEAFGTYICQQADEMGISPSTMARILLNEAIVKYRGLNKADLEKVAEDLKASESENPAS